MTKQSIPIEYDLYSVHLTPEFITSVNTTHDFLFEKYGSSYALNWRERIADTLDAFENPRRKWARLGGIDTIRYSQKYGYRSVEGTETVLFFLVEDDHIFLVASGWSRRDWPRILRQLEPELTHQIGALKAD